MRTFLGLLMAFVVSGETEVKIEGTLGDDVLLPCNCSDRDTSKDVKWQMEQPNPSLVLIHNGTASKTDGRFKGRANIFVHMNKNNCSLLLTNITAEDQGQYKCRFFISGKYTRFYNDLTISANYSICQHGQRTNVNGDSSRNVFQCDVQGRYRQAEIQWFLNETLLSNSSVTNITHTYPESDPTGLYSFKSKLITQLNWTTEPQCKVKAEGISSKIIDGCKESKNGIGAAQGSDHVQKFSIIVIIPIVLVLGLSLVLWKIYRRKFSQGLQKVTKVETDDY